MCVAFPLIYLRDDRQKKIIYTLWTLSSSKKWTKFWISRISANWKFYCTYLNILSENKNNYFLPSPNNLFYPISYVAQHRSSVFTFTTKTMTTVLLVIKLSFRDISLNVTSYLNLKKSVKLTVLQDHIVIESLWPFASSFH